MEDGNTSQENNTGIVERTKVQLKEWSEKGKAWIGSLREKITGGNSRVALTAIAQSEFNEETLTQEQLPFDEKKLQRVLMEMRKLNALKKTKKRDADESKIRELLVGNSELLQQALATERYGTACLDEVVRIGEPYGFSKQVNNLAHAFVDSSIPILQEEIEKRNDTQYTTLAYAAVTNRLGAILKFFGESYTEIGQEQAIGFLVKNISHAAEIGVSEGVLVDAIKEVARNVPPDQATEAGIALGQFAQSEKPEVKDIASKVIPSFYTLYNKYDQYGTQVTKDVATAFLNTFHLSGQEATNSWVESTKGYFANECFQLNLERMLAIERQEAGICKFLAEECNIFNFGKYPESTLINQYRRLKRLKSLPESERARERQSVLVVNPRFDLVAPHVVGGRVGSFALGPYYQESHLYETMQDQLDTLGYDMTIIEGGGQEIASVIDNIHELGGYQEIPFRIIAGHGTANTIQFGKNFRLTKQNMHEILPTVNARNNKRIYSPDVVTLLSSCSTGREEGLALEISKDGGTVVGAEQDFYHLEPTFSKSENKLGIKTVFKDYDGNIIKANVFRNGVKVE